MHILRLVRAYLLYTWGGLHRYFGNQDSLQREHERAIHYFARASDVYPGFRRARVARAVILWRELGRIDEALAEFDALLQEQPNDDEARFNRALARHDAGQYVGALADINYYLALPDPKYQRLAQRLQFLLTDIVAGNG